METWPEIDYFLTSIAKVSQICVINPFNNNVLVIKTPNYAVLFFEKLNDTIFFKMDWSNSEH